MCGVCTETCKSAPVLPCMPCARSMCDTLKPLDYLCFTEDYLQSQSMIKMHWIHRAHASYLPCTGVIVLVYLCTSLCAGFSRKKDGRSQHITPHHIMLHSCFVSLFDSYVCLGIFTFILLFRLWKYSFEDFIHLEIIGFSYCHYFLLEHTELRKTERKNKSNLIKQN